MNLNKFQTFPFILSIITLTLCFSYNNKNQANSKIEYTKADSLEQDTIIKTEEFIEFIPAKELEKLRKSLYSVSVSNFYNANEFLDSIKEKGYIARVYKWEKNQELSSFEEHSAIWLGYNVPAGYAVEIILLAVNFYPHLKYIYISGDEKGEPPPKDIHTNVYIGGATATAERLGLRTLTYEDFMKINSSMTNEELHKFIRGFYKQ